MKKVACVILNYNDSDTTMDLLNLIKNYETINNIVIVDNNSTDNSYSVLKKEESDKIAVIKSPRNGGYGFGNNIGFNYAMDNFQSDYIIIANPDVEFSNTSVLMMREFLSENENYAVVAPKSYDKKGSVIAWKIEKTWKIVASASLIITQLFPNITRYSKKYFETKKSSVDVDVVPGSLLMIDTEKMKENIYDEEIFLYFEEIILGQKIKDKGFKSAILLNTTYNHFHSVSISKNIKSAVKTKYYLLNSEIFYFKKYRNISAVKLLIVKMFFIFCLIEMFLYKKIFK